MGASICRDSRIPAWPAALVSLLVLASACGAQPVASPQVTTGPTQGATLEQNVPPTTGPTQGAALEQSVPATTGPTQGAAMEQNVPPTPELATIALPPGAQLAPAPPTPAKQTDCPDLESALFQLTQAPDPLKQAEQVGLKVREGKVQVLLVLDREDSAFLRGFDVEVGSQTGTKVQAFVPIDQLCALAKTDEVLAIRLAAQAIPQ